MWKSWVDALVDVYQLAERLALDYVQNKIIDSLMIASRDPETLSLRDPETLKRQSLTWILMKLPFTEQTKSSTLTRFLIDLVAYDWLTDPDPDQQAFPGTHIPPGHRSYLTAFLSSGNTYLIETLIQRILHQQALAVFSNVPYKHPGREAFCTYHIHRGTSRKNCPGRML